MVDRRQLCEAVRVPKGVHPYNVLLLDVVCRISAVAA